jgi:hypothetical protein
MICSNMNAHTAPPTQAADTDAPEAWERALLDRQLESLDRLAQMGLEVAGAIRDRVTDPAAADAAVQHAAMDFARVSRAVRMTVALQSKLVRDFKTPAKAGAPKSGESGEDEAPIEYAVYWANGEPLTRPARRRVLRESVRGLAQERGLDAETAERLQAEALEALERDDIAAMLNRPFAEIVALICEELGLKPPLPPRPPPLAGEGDPERVEGANHSETPSPSGPPSAVAPTWLSG